MSNNPIADELFGLADLAVEHAKKHGATTAEAVAGQSAYLTTRVRKHAPELVEEAGSRGLGIRVMLGQRISVVHTSDTTPEGIRAIVEDAVELAKLAQPDPFAGAPDPSLLSDAADHKELDLFDPTMSEMDAAGGIDRALACEQAAFDFDERIDNSEGATFSRNKGTSVLVTSGGFRGSKRGTYASLSVSPVCSDEGDKKRTAGYWGARRHLAELEDPEAIGREAARRTLAQLGAKKIETQEVPVIFDQDTARSILGFVASCVNGSSIWRESSFLAGKLNEVIASDLITIVDDPFIERGPGSRPFDGEGLLSRRNTIVDKGVLKSYLLDTYSAKKLDMESTANASRGSSGGVGPSSTNFILQPGDMTSEELIASTPRGLLVTQMMGHGFKAVTGAFSKGAMGYWIENGEKAFPVSEVTISLKLGDLLQRIDAVANDLDLRTSVASPSFRVSGMMVAGSDAS